MNTQMTVVIPTSNRNQLLSRTPRYLSQCKLPADYETTFVVENGGPHGAEAIVHDPQEWIDCNYIYYTPGNKSAALNYALEKIDDTLIVFFDDDVRVHPDTLMAYDRAAAESHVAYSLGDPWKSNMKKNHQSGLCSRVRCGAGRCRRRRNWGPDQSFLGANWAAFSSDLKNGWGFHPAVGPGGTSGGRGQELTMQGKLRSAGCKPFYVSDALVWHYVPKERSTEKWSLQRAYQMGVTLGLEAVNDAAQLLGVPRWAIKRYGVLLGKAMWGSLTKKRPKKYLAWREFHVLRGYLRGFRLRQQREGSHHPKTTPATEDISS